MLLIDSSLCPLLHACQLMTPEAFEYPRPFVERPERFELRAIYVKSVTRFLRTLLFGVGAIDGLTMAVVVALMSVVVVAATYLPASRAAGVDPMLAIRHD